MEHQLDTVRANEVLKFATIFYFCVENVIDSICRDQPSIASETKEHLKEICEMILLNHHAITHQMDRRKATQPSTMRTYSGETILLATPGHQPLNSAWVSTTSYGHGKGYVIED